MYETIGKLRNIPPEYLEEEFLVQEVRRRYVAQFLE
jgi:hypothetical protein